MPYAGWVAIPTLVCSSLSAVATGSVILMWLFTSHEEKHSFRYSLVMNLTIAEFINAFNNTVSGSIVVSTQKWLKLGLPCDINGWIGQLSVQAADFSVLAIAVVTLLTVNFNPRIMYSSTTEQRLICLFVWAIPFFTASLAFVTHKIEPVTGNWCWIAQDPAYLRYALGHGWRFAIFLAVIGIYVAVFFSVRRRLLKRNQEPRLQRSYSFSMYTEAAPDVNVVMSNNELIRGKHTMPTTVREAVTRSSSERNKTTGLEAAQEAKLGAQQRLGIKPRIRVIQSSELDHDTRHWLLLSLFPMAYIVVWIPGLANRFAEMAGRQEQWLIAAQATTQLTGLVNAMVYGFKEHRHMMRRRKKSQEIVTNKGLDLDI
ncbi:hypothetical protein DHEL01_v210848 [Diaporthe helianthi]|uniref:G-protein coupled receptors family 1 profile domain-containing protein n=1 Tax=Diaporthe helianthi TaxID=158607 RepID=A0A2P5HKI2_DIAHE|nr:hypothetical protein DHEL01_v210848 [Diaporthe helianthi]